MLATARLLHWCELAVLEHLGGCTVSTSVSLSVVALAVIDSQLSISAVCADLTGIRSTWQVTVRDENRLIARATLAFPRVDTPDHAEPQGVPEPGRDHREQP